MNQTKQSFIALSVWLMNSPETLNLQHIDIRDMLFAWSLNNNHDTNLDRLDWYVDEINMLRLSFSKALPLYEQIYEAELDGIEENIPLENQEA